MKLRPTPEDWKQRVESELGEGVSFDEALLTRTLEGITLEPLYAGRPALATGEGAMPRGGGWAVAPRVAHPSPRVANGHVLEHLEGGASGIEIDLSSVTLADAEDVRRLLDGVLLDAIPIAFTSHADALPVAALLRACIEERGTALAAVELHLGMDPFATLVRDGALPGDMDDARSELLRLALEGREAMARTRVAVADGSTWHRVGADAALELGLATASFVEGLRWLEEGGLDAAAAQEQYVWRVDLDADVFGGIAKCRAARALHARVLGAAGADEVSPLVLHATTSPRVITARDAWTNMLRGTLGTFAGAAGGADLITALPFDAALAGDGEEPSPLARRVARNTQLVLQMESRLDHVGDPAGGGFYVESRTDELARLAWAVLQEIEAAGGMSAAVASGLVDGLLDASRDRLVAAYRDGSRELVGVTAFPPPEGAEAPRPAPMDDVEEAAAARAARIEARGHMALGSIDDLEHATRAAAAGATRSEIGAALVRGASTTRGAVELVREETLAATEESS
ncbi:MAG: methylmalonyl-CoA mutase family protein [Planctomycetota bacterium]|nr:methylmalonyl-CoA mutase family protein [Planctomycetota bacterium]